MCAKDGVIDLSEYDTKFNEIVRDLYAVRDIYERSLPDNQLYLTDKLMNTDNESDIDII